MIRFEEETHRYFDGDKELISVTQLMAKHGLAPDYSRIPDRILREKAERGKLIHKEIEDYIKTGEIGFTPECGEFVDYIAQSGAMVTGSEKIVHNDICAGTVDLFLIDADGHSWIADIKTTAKIHWEAIAWQLSLYNALSGYTAKRFSVFYFDKDGLLDVKDIVPKSKDEVERLFDCEREGKMFFPKVPAIIGDTEIAELAEIERVIAEAKRTKEEAEEREKAIKEAIIKAMEQNGITEPIDCGSLRITYVAPYEKNTIDSARLKKELPEVAEQYTKKSTVSATIRIAFKEDKQK